MAADETLHILVPQAECKAALGLDARDDDFTRFLLVAATYTAENYLSRRILRRRHTEYFDSLGQNAFFLREYPIREIVSVNEDRAHLFPDTSLIDREHYYFTPDPESLEDLPGNLSLIPPYQLSRAEKSIKAVYSAGYDLAEVPPDLKEAVIEIVAWNHTRYKSRRIGITGAIRGSGKDGESLETTLPEFIRTLLEPYRRRTI